MASETIKDNRNTSFGDKNSRVLDVYYTDRNTKLSVVNGVLVEEKIQVSSHDHTSPSPSPSPAPWCSMYYSSSPPPKRPPPSDEDKAALLDQNIRTAKVALEYYNTKHNVTYELVDPISSGGNLWAGGLWYHCNFTAKLEGQDSSFTKVFFAEIKVAKFDHKSLTTKYMVTACRTMDGKTTKQCEMCGNDAMLHPTYGYRHGRYKYKTRALRPRDHGKVIRQSNQSKEPPLWYGPRFSPMAP